jgi:hypothetical protein
MRIQAMGSLEDLPKVLFRGWGPSGEGENGGKSKNSGVLHFSTLTPKDIQIGSNPSGMSKQIGGMECL